MCPVQFMANALKRISFVITRHGGVDPRRSNRNCRPHSTSSEPDREGYALEHSSSADPVHIFQKPIAVQPTQRACLSPPLPLPLWRSWLLPLRWRTMIPMLHPARRLPDQSPGPLFPLALRLHASDMRTLRLHK